MPAPRTSAHDDRTERIMRTTVALAREVGYSNLGIEAVAAGAGVGKHTVYRRWSSKGALFLDSVLTLHASSLDYPDTGDVVADVKRQIYDAVDLLASDEVAPLFRALVAEAQRDDEVAAALVERFAAPQKAKTVARLAAARSAGQIAADADLELAMVTLSGPLYYLLLVTHEPVTHDVVDRIVDALFAGLTPRA
ncbi:TetR/AcrR family transcriptional regulator [Isoptericola sp. 4D.3]|uniref:TetR/AcrR family transcriptional regulator n=1 Tax=Isoptericola peretonis TaxID=2918523 RepID=A0ABT0J2C3_9MICO|nr:TetR/AcrR family transcriptional regulator [Isoptericola sp. 4D.3]